MKIETLKKIIIAFVAFTIAIFGVFLAIYLRTIDSSAPLWLYIIAVVLCIFAIIEVATLILDEYLIDVTILFYIKKNETKIVKNGRSNLICWYRTNLSNPSQILLVKLAETSEKHRRILLNYRNQLCYEAASNFIKSNVLFGCVEEYLVNVYKYNGLLKWSIYSDEVKNILLILSEESKSNPKYGEILRRFIENNKDSYIYLTDEDIIENLIQNGEIKILTKVCQNEKYMTSKNETTLVRFASKDCGFNGLLKEYLNAIKNGERRYQRIEDYLQCHKKDDILENNISENAENELMEHGSYDIIKIYCKYVKNIRYMAQTLLAKRYQDIKDPEILEILYSQKYLCNEALTIIRI